MSFPSTVPLRYPLQRTVRVASRVAEFLDGSEQRFRAGPVLNAFSFTLANIPIEQVDDVRDWFLAAKGAYDTTLTLAVGAATFPNMCLESDELAVTEEQPTRFSLSLAMRQVAPSGSWPSVTAVFPGISGGRLVQRPWSGKDRFLTTRNDLASGARYSYYERGTPLRAWDAAYSCITVANLTTLMEFFVGMGGKLGAFEMTDPETLDTFSNCRFDTDEFRATYVDAGHCSVSLPIVEFAA
jgi:hypothetical protein